MKGGQISADSIRFDGGTVHLCIDKDAARTCWAGDVAKQQFVAEAVTPPPKDDAAPPKEPFPTATVEGGVGGSIGLCPPAMKEGESCKTFAIPSPPAGEAHMNVSDDLATVTVGSGHDLRVFDAATGKLRGTIKAWKTAMEGNPWPDTVQFAGDHMMVWYSASPISSSAKIFDLDGKQLADVGPKDFTVTMPNVRVSPTEWVSMQVDGNNLVVVDLAKATQTTYDVKPLEGPAPNRPNPELPIALYAASKVGDKVVVVSGENPPSVGVLDAGGKLAHFAPPACK